MRGSLFLVKFLCLWNTARKRTVLSAIIADILIDGSQMEIVIIFMNF